MSRKASVLQASHYRIHAAPGAPVSPPSSAGSKSGRSSSSESKSSPPMSPKFMSPMPFISKPLASPSSSESCHLFQSTLIHGTFPLPCCNDDQLSSSAFLRQNSISRLVLHLESSFSIGLKNTNSNSYKLPPTLPEKFSLSSAKLTFMSWTSPM